MPYVRRDETGKVDALFRQPEDQVLELLEPNHPDVVGFLFHGIDDQAEEETRWINSDLSMARVVEDLVDLMLRKKMVSFTELPIPAQQKLMGRHGLRHDLSIVGELFPTEEDEDLVD